MPAIRLRPFEASDGPRITTWFLADQEGFEQLMGIPIANELGCTMAVTSLLQSEQQGQAVVRMVECDDRTIGAAILTDVVPANRTARPHLYVAPKERRHSLAVARASEAEAKSLGVQSLFTTVSHTNTRALALARRMGYGLVPQALLVKELS